MNIFEKRPEDLSEADIIYDWNEIDRKGRLLTRPFAFFDETLRDGIQSPSVRDPSIGDKLEILHLLESIGIDAVDLGLPGAGKRAADDCIALGRESEFQHIEARARAVQVVVLAALTVAGGAIVTFWGFAAGWLAETGLCALGAFVAIAMIEPPPADDHESDEDGASTRVKVPWKIVALLILPLAFLDAAGQTGSFLVQTMGDRSAAGVTVIVALIALADATGSAFATWLPATGVRVQLAFAAVGSALVITALMFPAALVPATIALSFGTGVLHPLRAAAIQRIATDNVRARAASVASACDMALSTLFLLLAGTCLARKS